MSDVLTEDKAAIKHLKQILPPAQHVLLNSIQLLTAGKTESSFNITRSPFWHSLLEASYLQGARYLIEKTSLGVPLNQGFNLMGVVDCDRVLSPGEVFVQVIRSPDPLPPSYPSPLIVMILPLTLCLKVIQEGEAAIVMEGTCAVYKNPGLHPGDVRLLRARYGEVGNCVSVNNGPTLGGIMFKQSLFYKYQRF